MPRPARWLTLFITVALAVSSCNAPTSPLPTETPAPSPTPTDTPTPEPTATPTPEPQTLIEQADSALGNGDWLAAMTAYQAILSSSAAQPDMARAQLGIGTTQLRAGNFKEADDSLTQYLSAYPDDAASAEGYFLRAIAREELGLKAEAIQDLRQFLSVRPGQIDAYVHEKLGDLLRATGAPMESVAEYQAAIDAPRLGDAIVLGVKIGRAYQEAGDLDRALAQYDNLAQSTNEPSTLATLNFLAGLTLEKKGDTAAAHERYLDSVHRFPQAYDTYSGLVRLVDAGVPVDGFTRGLIDYNAGAYEPARTAFDKLILTAPTAAAYYYRGLSLLELGDAAGAAADLRMVVSSYPEDSLRADAWLTLARLLWLDLDDYEASIQTYLDFVATLPSHPSAAQALFDAGRVAERSGDLGRAAEIWMRLPVQYPGTAQAFFGAFQAGIARTRQQDPTQALAAFQKAQEGGLDPEQHAAAFLWIGKSRLAMGDDAGARQAWEAAAATDPTGYYSLRAEDLLAGRQPFQSLGMFDFATNVEAERMQAEDWLRSTFAIVNPEPLTALTPALRDDPRMIRAEEFLQLGLFEEAMAEVESLRKDVAGDAEATYRLMHRLLELHLYRPAIFAARQILQLAGMDDAATANAPVYFNHIRFGPYFGDLILPAAAEEGFDPLFLLSVVRQESLFEGFATSYAEARGLMQVIPSTGAMLAEQLGWPPDYTDMDLYRPVVSVRFGAAYLAEQRDRFNGDLYAALAGYNAGPGNAMAWKDLAPQDPDLFLEVIRLDQPHQYIMQIYEMYARYRSLYATPS